jgi:type IX secretion system PorP/SprF family membrane protein
MRIRNTIILFFILCTITKINAQDRHFTLYNFAPLVINPAYTGAYEGSYRVGGLLREQAFSNNIPDLGSVYSTQSGFVDAPLLNVRKRDWVGLGANFYSDKAGTFGLGYTTIHGSVAYHLALDKRRKSVLTLGIQGGVVMRTVGRGFADDDNNIFVNAIFPDEPTTMNPSLDGMSPFTGMGDPMANFFDLGAGMLLKSKLNKTTNIEIGFSLQHITGNVRINTALDSTSIAAGNNRPSSYILNGLTDNDDFRIPKVFVLHGTYDMELTDTWLLSPSFLFQQARNQNEAVIQFLGGYKLMKREIRDDGKKGKFIKDKDAPKIRFGLGYRVGDALQVLLGYEKGDLRVGIGYDLTLSTLADANNSQGGLEIAANYIFRVYKQPNVDPAILCPKF